MKTILLPIHADDASESRLQAALALARVHDAHLLCLQTTPYTAYTSSDIYGGVNMAAALLTSIHADEAKLREETTVRLAGGEVRWSYEHADGEPAQAIVERAGLADVIVLSRARRAPGLRDPLPLAGDVALHARAPVLAVPPLGEAFDPAGAALVAWNGSSEAANALRAALPMLATASAIHLVTVDESEPKLPIAAACEFLERHLLHAHAHHQPRADTPIADVILSTADRLGAAYLVIGAYGHSRAREYLLGGVTRSLLGDCPAPLLLAH